MAGRIPQSFLDDLLDRTDIVEVIDRRVKLKKSGKNYTARCPFHEEKTPSFSVNPDKQFFYCFGCGAGGNALGFVMDYDHVDFPQAVETLATAAGLEVPREQPSPQEAKRRETGRELYELMEQVSRFYRQALRKHPSAHSATDYLKGRGMTGLTAKHFEIGFAPPGWDNLMAALASSDGQRALLLKSGMLVQNDAGKIYDRFRNRVMFPIRDQRGRVVAFGGRVLGDDKPKYLNSPETEIFHKSRELYGLYEVRKSTRQPARILVVEGYMDVIALAQYGISNAVATLGTATSRQHLERIFRICPEVVFCFDGDEAGRQAAARAMETTLPCMQDGRQAKFLFLPEGEDPDSLVHNRGADYFNSQVSKAQPLEEFLFTQVSGNIDASSLDGRARLSQLALPLLQQIPEGVYRQLMYNALAEKAGLSVEELLRLKPLEKHKPAQTPDQQEEKPSRSPPQRPSRAIKRGFANLAQSALALLLHKPEIATMVEVSKLDCLEGEDIGLLREILDHLGQRPESTTATLLGRWYGTSEGELLSRLASQERLIPAEGIEQQFIDTIEMLVRQPEEANLDSYITGLKASNYAELSEMEKLQLKALLQKKQQRDAKRVNERGGK